MINENKRRNDSLKFAVVSSIGSKFGTILLRFVSIPIAIRTLGMDLFGIYVTLLVFFQIIDFLYIGIGASVTQQLSKCQGKPEREARVFTTGYWLNSACTVFFALIFAIVLLTVPVTTLFGDKFGVYEKETLNSAWITLVLVVIGLHGVIGARARDGYMETWITNLWGAAGNLTAAVLLVVAMLWVPRIEFLLLAVNGSIVLILRLGNLFHLFVSRKHLIPWFRNFDRKMMVPMLKEGLFFNITYSLSAVVEYTLTTWLLGRYFGPAIAGSFSVIVALHVSILGLLDMVTVPAWPALLSAKKNGDYHWIRHMAGKLRLTALVLGLGILIFYMTIGPDVVRIWIGSDLKIDQFGLIGFAVYSGLNFWRAVNQTLILGLGKAVLTARIVIIESTLTAVFVGTGIAFLQSPGVALSGMALSLLLVNAWIFPLILQKLMKDHKKTILPAYQPGRSQTVAPSDRSL